MEREEEIRINREKLMEESFHSIQAAIDAAGIIYFEYYPEQGKAIEYNRRELFSLEKHLDNYPQCWFDKGITHPDDQETLWKAFLDMKGGSRFATCEVRNMMEESYHWYHYNFTSIYDADGKRIKVVCTAQDITAQRESEERLQESNAMYRLTTQYTQVNIWQYDILNDVLYNREGNLNRYFDGKVVPDYSSYVIENNLIRKDSVPAFRAMIQELRSGAREVTRDIWVRPKNLSEGEKIWRCERMTYVVISDSMGVPIRALGMGKDITELKEVEKRIREEQKYQEAIESENLIEKLQGNITLNRVERYFSKCPLEGIKVGVEYDEALKRLKPHTYNDTCRERIDRYITRESIRKATEEGKEVFSFEYRRKIDGRFIWVNHVARIFRDPEDQNIRCFMYVYDINNEKTIETILNRISEKDYELLSLIYLDTGILHILRSQARIDEEIRSMDKEYESGAMRLVERCFEENLIEEGKEAFSISSIKKNLEKNNVYTLTYSMKNEGKKQRKKWEFSYLDDSRSSIVLTRADVTELFEKQEQQREDLRNALIQAEQASYAKSNFLSRMSHEIRTPMNAIIGMSALAAQCLNDPEQVKDCLSKVGISARFLLSLINDILDMSRIESGKVTVKNEKFPFEELINSVNTIIYEQASQKRIDYECVLTSFTAPYYFGDSMKLQQILVNLLGNAVKFTGASGKVQLIIRQEKVEEGRAHMVFSINDTGVGITQEAQRKIFEPFEQGDSTITTPYKGTGLGLAICKNLVSMMGGTIKVNSIEGVGSEFTVKVTLGVCEEELPYKKLETTMLLEKLNTLVIDDDITICEHTKEILLDMGMHAEWVESGRKAVELVKHKWQMQQFFDVILVDWKMPDMDGIETAREIRKIVGPDVTIIVMTAYDWAEIEQDAKLAGVNLLVSKPLFKSSLTSVFERIYTDKEQKKQEKEPIVYNFEGKTILLVEDHILNVEVARRLLESKHAAVEVAENGLQAIEAYAQAEDGHFDAILMDIRMPVMDGLTAARSIRQLRKVSARTVPIIAMSANAFEEDVEKSKAAGMDEHLSKPIEPEMLFAVLQKWLDK